MVSVDMLWQEYVAWRHKHAIENKIPVPSGDELEIFKAGFYAGARFVVTLFEPEIKRALGEA